MPPDNEKSVAAQLLATGRFDEAILQYQRILQSDPDFPEGWNNLANACLMLGRHGDAISAYQRALALRPQSPHTLNNLGKVFEATGNIAGAIAAYRGAIAMQPDLALVHFNLGLALLLDGQFEEGWKQFEWRWKTAEFADRVRNDAEPRWDGSALRGRRILIYSEQGFGDTIQFARYLQPVVERGGEVLLDSPPELRHVLAGMRPAVQLVSSRPTRGDFDVHCPLLSLPLTLGLPEPIWSGPYLHADASRAAKFDDLVQAAGDRFKLGIVWTGRSQPPGRSIPLKLLKPLASDRVQLFSLQVGEGRQQIRDAGFSLIDVADRLKDFADTAAMMQRMDLILSIDTAAAQLAGAMGLPTWLLLKKAPDWRWMMDRGESPWYPTIRLFRQHESDDWSAPILRVAEALRAATGA